MTRGHPCKFTNNCTSNVPAKYFLVNKNKMNPRQDPASGAWLPAITVCNQGLYPEGPQVFATGGYKTTGFSFGFDLFREEVTDCPTD